MSESNIRQIKRLLLDNPEMIQEVAMHCWLRGTKRQKTSETVRQWHMLNYANRQEWINRTWKILTEFWNAPPEERTEAQMRVFEQLLLVMGEAV
jgi:hypothetical protein